MRARQSPVESLVMLPHLGDPHERSTRFRQAIAVLGQELRVDGPPLLDGISTGDLVRASQVALETGLIDDLDWIAPGAAAVALYELSSALPAGRERREIGRRVFARLYEGNASTFAAVATRMALGPGRPFEAPTLRARIGLVFNLPVGTSVNADPLALALLSRRELFDRWISKAALGPLPARRLAARIFERAAREAVRLSTQGDPSPTDLLSKSNVKTLFDRLLADREPLVWRHAACARGILAAALPAIRDDIAVALDPSLSPTEWRRAAVSLVASLSTDLAVAAAQCEELLTGEILKKDPGMAATVLWGLSPVVEAEPEAAAELLDRLSFSSRPDVGEAMSALLCDVSNLDFGADAAARLRSTLLRTSGSVDPTMQAIYADTLRGLDRNRSLGSVHAIVRRALEAFETTGARAATDLALEAIARAHATMDALETLGKHGELPDLLGPLGDLDSSAIEHSRLHDLLLLGRSPGDTSATVPEMERLYDRLGTWILDREESYEEKEFSRGEMIGRQRTLRALLHLVDLDTSTRSDGEGDAVRPRLRRTVRALFRSLAMGPDAAIHRILCATLARALDAAAREGLADPADLLLSVIARIGDGHSVQAMMEASTNPDVRDGLRAYADFLLIAGRESEDAAFELSADAAEARGADETREALAFVELSRGIGRNGSHRGEALRQVVLRLGRALESISTARGLLELVEPQSGEGYPIGDLEHHGAALGQLIDGAVRRLSQGHGPSGFDVVADVPRLSALVERATSGVLPNRTQLASSISEFVSRLPPVIAAVLSRVLGRIAFLPLSPPTDVGPILLQTRRAELPPWLLPRRTIGAFYVVRALGAGGVSSVFVARRIEERRTAGAELFALKVPHYDPSTARSLSEAEFMQLFREEAGALLSLPQHPNLARFVTFDLAARPKPILVMELISGFGLDRLIRNRSMTISLALDHLDGILAGLEAMHSVGVGHLDVKPSNVIFRDESTPVLVDFGLSGRHLRPGCGTLEYCAPEVLGVDTGAAPTPMAADIYAFACTAFELLTGTLLFDASDETALINQHLLHDGWPDWLTQLGAAPEHANFAVVLASCLRRSPSSRPAVKDVRRALAGATQWLAREPWPLAPSLALTGLTA